MLEGHRARHEDSGNRTITEHVLHAQKVGMTSLTFFFSPLRTCNITYSISWFSLLANIKEVHHIMVE